MRCAPQTQLLLFCENVTIDHSAKNKKKLLAALVTKMVAAGIAHLELQEGPSCLVNNWSFRNPQSVAVQARGTLYSWTPEINVEGMLTRVRKDINKSIGHEIKGVKSHKG